MGKNKKRKHSQYAQDLFLEGGVSTVGVGAMLEHLQAPELATQDAGVARSTHKHDHVQIGHGSGLESEEWTYVGRGKRQKKDHQFTSKGNEQGQSKDNYPGLTYAELHKLQSCLKISDLQSLVLYCLADGTSPQWVSVRHHNNVKKAVVLFVPGLEKGMFNGGIKLEESTSMIEDTETPTEFSNNVNGFTKPNVVTSITQNLEVAGSEHTATSPDDYLPIRLDSEKLPSPVKSLADVFTHIWPVKAPGDDKYFKVHSPLHAMLTSHIPKSQEEKRAGRETKGPKEYRAGRNWDNKRTPITAFIASKEDLQDNEFVLHPVYFTTHQQKLFEELRRHDAKQTEQWSWKDSLVNNLADGAVPDKDIQKGSLTSGCSILAMDCEMCKVEGDEMALTRISVLDWDGGVVMDELVKPEKPIVDYLTP